MDSEEAVTFLNEINEREDAVIIHNCCDGKSEVICCFPRINN